MGAEPDGDLPASVRVVIEVPRGGFVKRAANGQIDFVSPLPSPFNYGSVPDRPGFDGEPADALVLGPPLARGHIHDGPVYGRVLFWDEGVPDPKLICGHHPPTPADERAVTLFFSRYARLKAGWAFVRGRGTVRFDGLEWRR